MLTQYNGQTFTYDEIGNPLNYRDGMSFTWQNGRQLSRAQNSEELISYSYNADGIRTRKLRSNGETTDYYLNGSNIITQITNSILNPDHSVRLDFYYDESSSLLGFAYDGQDYWYIRNGQGDIIGILDKGGTQVVSYTYDSWGVPISTTGTLADTIGQLNPFRYRGYYFDAELGLYYLNSRYYDPMVGRFLNADGFVLAGGGLLSTNMYFYCANNPIHRTDPSGKHFFDTPLSTAALQTMSQTQRDEYYTALNAYRMAIAGSITIELSKGWTARIDPKNDAKGEQRHIHIERRGEEYSQNVDGSPHKGSKGKPDKTVRKEVLKKMGWDWDKKAKSYDNQQKFMLHIVGCSPEDGNCTCPDTNSIIGWDTSYFIGTTSTYGVPAPVPAPSFPFSFGGGVAFGW